MMDDQDRVIADLRVSVGRLEVLVGALQVAISELVSANLAARVAVCEQTQRDCPARQWAAPSVILAAIALIASGIAGYVAAVGS
jgi:hypothetical protein